MYRTGHTPAAIVIAAALILGTGCASSPQGGGGATSTGPAATGTNEEQFDTGRLVVIVTDQNGRALDRAVVDVTSTGARHYRTSGVTNRDGTVSFNGVPQRVNVDIQHQGGRYSNTFNVAPTGVSEMRVRVDIQEIEAPAQPADQGGGGFGF